MPFYQTPSPSGSLCLSVLTHVTQRRPYSQAIAEMCILIPNIVLARVRYSLAVWGRHVTLLYCAA